LIDGRVNAHAGGSIGRVERMGGQERGSAIVGLKERCIQKDHTSWNGNPLIDGRVGVNSCGGSIGRVERMGGQERGAAIVGLKERCIHKT
jgi:hypothetical protein